MPTFLAIAIVLLALVVLGLVAAAAVESQRRATRRRLASHQTGSAVPVDPGHRYEHGTWNQSAGGG